MSTIFDELAEAYRQEGTAVTLRRLADHLRQQKRYHELFETLKLNVRERLGLPLLYTELGEDLEPDRREALEQGLIDACREVGQLLLNEGRLRDSWHYLRAVGDRAMVGEALARMEPPDEHLDEYLELCIHEGLDLERGFRTMLEHYGTCNSITTFDSTMYGRPRSERALGAALLVAHLHTELRANVRAHIEREEGAVPADDELTSWIATRPWLFAEGTYHTDTTHLASVVRFARDLDEPGVLRRALDLAHYGQRLDPSLQYPGDEPFEDLHATSARFFSALLDDSRDEHLAYFRERAEAVNPREDTTLAIETYVDLLARVGEPRTALHEALRLLPEGVQTTGRSPSLLELAAASDEFAPLEELSRRRNDALGFTLSLLRARSG